MEAVIAEITRLRIGPYAIPRNAIEFDAKRVSSGFTIPGPGADEEGSGDRS
jgi:hypothetical protein